MLEGESGRMKVLFSCPSCGVSGSVDESFAGRQVRCNQCRHRFPIPAPGSVEPDGYALDAPEPEQPTFDASPMGRAAESVFSPTLSDEPEDKDPQAIEEAADAPPRKSRNGRIARNLPGGPG